MRLRILLVLLGLAMGAFGLVRFLQHDLSDMADAVLWLAGGVLLHDAVIAPLTIGATLLVSRLIPRRARVATTTALIVLLTVTATAVPVLGSWGARSDNATLLDRGYSTGWWVFAAGVLLIGLLTFLRQGRRLRHQEPAEREAG